MLMRPKNLDEAVSELLSDMFCDTDNRHCFSQNKVCMEGTDRQ